MTAVAYVEKKIIKRAIDIFLKAGYSLSVNDGEELTVTRSKDRAAIINAMRTTDEDYLIAHKAGKKDGWVRFIYGNDGHDVINDYTMSLEPEMGAINEYTKKFG